MSTETKTVCLSRRECLQKAAIVGSSLSVAALSGCSEVVRRTIPARVAAEKIALPPTSDLDPVVRLLNRAGFGPAPGDIASVAAQGTVAYVKSQLAAPTDDDAEEMGLKLRLANIEVLSGDPYDLNDLGDSEILRQLSQATLLRAIYSPYQLRERMVDFWSNHFNLYARKRISGGDLSPVFVQSLVGRDSLSVIRQHALGHFPTMLKASARSPAMLTYLDNQKNRKGVANENYAREIMELHTLGIGGGYTQKDVQEVARCLTGWGIEDGFMRNRESFAYDKNQHDDGEKIVLGHRIPSGGGESDGDTVLEILARHPSTAKFIAKKMVNYLYGAEDAGLIAETAAVYSKTDGDISAMVSHLLLSEKMADAPPILKRPFDFRRVGTASNECEHRCKHRSTGAPCVNGAIAV